MASLSLRAGGQEIILSESEGVFENHRHKKIPCFSNYIGYSLKYACNGHEVYWLNGKRLHLAPGEALFMNHQFARANRFEAEPLSKGLCLYCDDDEMEALCELSEKGGSALFNSIQSLPELKFPKDHSLCQILDGIFGQEAGEGQWQEDLVFYFWQEFLENLDDHVLDYSLRLEGLNPATRQSLMYKIQKADQFMRENLSSYIQLEDIAQHVGLSHYHFQRQYKRATGLSPNKRLLQWRIIEAQNLILAGNLQIVDIAARLSYNDLATFSKAFKRECGLSPMQWKKKHLNTKKPTSLANA